MESISGLTNWRLTVRREDGGVTILRALTCDKKAVLPDGLFGLPVTVLQDHALASGAAPAEGEELRILGGAEVGDWDNRNIVELTLPRFLREIGDYAFMNLRSMEMLRFSDDLCSTGSGSFMNCRSFSRLELRRTGPHQGPALAFLVHSLQQKLDVTVIETDGSILRLIFPEYFEDYTENRNAYTFQLRIVGGGFAYHNVFRDRALSVSDYDALWPAYIAQEHDEETALNLAYGRFCCPTRLSDQAAERYAQYLRKNLDRALSLALQQKDMRGLQKLLDLDSIETETLDAALRESRTLQTAEATAILLEKRHARPAAGRAKTFDL